MKSIPSGLLAAYANRSMTIATALRIAAENGDILGFTSGLIDVPINGVIYLASPGLDVSSIVTTAGTAVGTLELKTLHDGTVFQTVDVFSRKWSNADFQVFRYDYTNPGLGVEVLITGQTGQVSVNRGIVRAELRDLRQYLQQPIGDVTQKNCRARLGDAKCRKDLTDFTFTGAVTSLDSNQVIYDIFRVEADTYFDDGTFKWLSGDNVTGLKVKVRSFLQAGGKITLAFAAPYNVQVGDTYEIVAGCLRRFEEDCRDKFNNVLNYQGEKDAPTMDEVTRSVAVSV